MNCGWVESLECGARETRGRWQAGRVLVEDERLVAVQAGMVELVEPGVEQVRHWKRMWEIWLVDEADCSMRETTDNQQAHVPEKCSTPRRLLEG